MRMDNVSFSAIFFFNASLIQNIMNKLSLTLILGLFCARVKVKKEFMDYIQQNIGQKRYQKISG